MIKSQGNKYQLSPTQIQRIGTSEMGTRFRGKSSQEQKEIVSRVLSNMDFIDEMIRLSGFARVDIMLYKCIEKQSSHMVSENIHQTMPDTSTVSIDNIIPTLIPILNSYIKIKRVDKDMYDGLMVKLVEVIHQQIFSKIIVMTDINQIIDLYEQIMNEIQTSITRIQIPQPAGYMSRLSSMVSRVSSVLSYKQDLSFVTIGTMFEPFVKFNEYSTYLANIVIGLIKEEFSTCCIPVKKILVFKTIYKIGQLNKEIIEQVLDKIISNLNGKNTFIFGSESDDSHSEIIETFNRIKIADNFMQFLRFFIRNNIESKYYHQSSVITKLLMYKQFGEIPIQEYIRFKINHEYEIFSKYEYIFDIGLPTSITSDKNYTYDLYYINLPKKISNEYISSI